MQRGEQWRDIPGYAGWYQASNLGRVRTWHSRNGQGWAKAPAIMQTTQRSGCASVSLRSPDTGKPKIRTVAAIVYMTWVGPIPKGRRVIHRTLDTADNRPDNLFLGSRSAQARRMFAKGGPSRRKPVLKISPELEIVAVYQSAREADRENHFASSVLDDYCNLKRQSVIAMDGYIYAWDDDRWLARTLRRAKAELDALGIRYNDPFTSRYYDLPEDPEPAAAPGILWADAPRPGGGGTISETL